MFDLKDTKPLCWRAWITLEVALASPAAGPGARHAGALAGALPTKWARGIAAATTVIRGIPDLVLMMLLFFGRPGAHPAGSAPGSTEAYNYLLASNQIRSGSPCCPDYIDISPFAAGVYHRLHLRCLRDRDLPRRAILAVDGGARGRRAFGMRASQVFVRILFPR